MAGSREDSSALPLNTPLSPPSRSSGRDMGWGTWIRKTMPGALREGGSLVCRFPSVGRGGPAQGSRGYVQLSFCLIPRIMGLSGGHTMWLQSSLVGKKQKRGLARLTGGEARCLCRAGRKVGHGRNRSGSRSRGGLFSGPPVRRLCPGRRVLPPAWPLLSPLSLGWGRGGTLGSWFIPSESSPE